MTRLSKKDALEVKLIQQMKRGYPNMPESLIKKLDKWERVLRGDIKATIEQTIAFGMATKEDFEFTKEEWFKDE